MAATGKLASFKLGAVVYDQDDCLQGWSLNDAINEVVYQCNSFDQGIAGTRTVTFNASLALAATDTVKLAAFTPGTVYTTFEAHPAGDTALNVEIASTSAVIITANQSTAPNAIYAVDLSIRLNNVTIGAAT
jgi:spore germination protein YaaH